MVQLYSTDGHVISDIEEGSISYFGYLSAEGGWYILKEDSTAKTYRYFKGGSDYTTNWTNRASLAYDYYNVIFG